MNQTKTVRWGILGTARIATQVAAAIDATPGAEVAAVASRTAERADVWAKQHGVSRSYGEYRALLDDDELDVIYIPLPPSMHAEWTIRSAEAGKHVLCEKALAMNAAAGEGMAAACRENNVQLMDATMWVHHPRAADMLRPIHVGTIGELRRVTSAFSFMIAPYLKNKPPHMAGDPRAGNVSFDRTSSPRATSGDAGETPTARACTWNAQAEVRLASPLSWLRATPLPIGFPQAATATTSPNARGTFVLPSRDN